MEKKTEVKKEVASETQAGRQAGDKTGGRVKTETENRAQSRVEDKAKKGQVQDRMKDGMKDEAPTEAKDRVQGEVKDEAPIKTKGQGQAKAKSQTLEGRKLRSWAEVLKRYPEANFLQSPMCEKMNELTGTKVYVRDFSGKTGNFGRALIIVRDAKRGRYLEIPCGPLIDWEDQEMVEATMKGITEIAKAEKCVFVRIRPQIPANVKNLKLLDSLGLRQSPMHLAAENTVIIDLTKTEKELLSAMRRQTRYEIRKAERMKVKVNCDNSEAMFREFHAVQAETAKRQGFVPPDLKTLLAEREAFGSQATIYRALTLTDEPIAYGLIIWDGLEGDYYEAASTDLNRKMPGAYAILWQAMRDLKAKGLKRFNLWGIAPPGQPHHRYAKVTLFKTGFGGEVVEYVPAHDLVLSKMGYLKDLAIETARKKHRRL